MVSATPVGARYSPKISRRQPPHSPVVTPAFAQAIDGSMTLRPSLAARASSSRAAATAFASRDDRQAFSRSICSYSTSSLTVMMASLPAESGEGSVVVKALTPTIFVSPDSIAAMRWVLLSTSLRFM